MNAPAMLSEQKPSGEITGAGYALANVRRLDQMVAAILDEHHAAIRDLQRQFTELADLRTALGADALTSHAECVTAAIEGRKALAAEADSVTHVTVQTPWPMESFTYRAAEASAAEIPGDALVMLEQLRDTLPEFTTDPTEFVICIIAALEAERAGADIRVENAQGALRLAQEALAAEQRAHESTCAQFTQLQDDFEELRQTANALEGLVDERFGIINELRSDLAARDATIAELEKKLANVTEELQGEKVAHAAHHTHENQANEQLKAEASDLREKLASAELLLGQADETVAYLREKLRQAEFNASTSESDAQKLLRERNDAWEKLRQAEERATEEIRQNHEAQKLVRTFREAGERLQTDLTTARAESASLTDRLAEVERGRGLLQTAGNALMRERDELQQRIDNAVTEVAPLYRADSTTAIGRALAFLTSTQPESSETQLAARSSEGTLRGALSDVLRSWQGYAPECMFTAQAFCANLERLLAAHPAENPTPAAGETKGSGATSGRERVEELLRSDRELSRASIAGEATRYGFVVHQLSEAIIRDLDAAAPSDAPEQEIPGKDAGPCECSRCEDGGCCGGHGG